MSKGVRPHDHIVKLARHSETIRFVLKLRPVFIRLFRQLCDKDPDAFPGIDCEALFAGSVLHSLDHSMTEHIIPDEVFLDGVSPRFGQIVEFLQVALFALNRDLPGLPWRPKCRDSTHAFFKAVYDRAHKINPTYADLLDGCIIK